MTTTETTVGIATGAGRGMGSSCAERLTSMVDVLVLADRDEAGLDATAESLAGRGTEVRTAVVDVSHADEVQSLADQVAELGTFRALAHAAGISPTMARWRDIVTVDLVGSALLLDRLHPLVTEHSAAVCFASMAAHFIAGTGDPKIDAVLDDPLADGFLDALAEAAAGAGIEDSGVAYGWAKRGVQRLVQREAIRWGERGGRVCSISPGMIDTPQGRQEAEQQPMMQVMLERTPLGRFGRSEELAAVVAFLLSDEASFLTGTDVLVDGGVVAAVTSGPPLL